MANQDDLGDCILIKVVRAGIAAFLVALLVAFVSGLTAVPKGDAMGYAFAFAVFAGIAGLLTPVRR